MAMLYDPQDSKSWLGNFLRQASSITISRGSFLSHSVVVPNVSLDAINAVIAGMIPVEYADYYMRFILESLDAFVIDYGSHSDFIWITRVRRL